MEVHLGAAAVGALGLGFVCFLAGFGAQNLPPAVRNEVAAHKANLAKAPREPARPARELDFSDVEAGFCDDDDLSEGMAYEPEQISRTTASLQQGDFMSVIQQAIQKQQQKQDRLDSVAAHSARHLSGNGVRSRERTVASSRDLVKMHLQRQRAEQAMLGHTKST